MKNALRIAVAAAVVLTIIAAGGAIVAVGTDQSRQSGIRIATTTEETWGAPYCDDTGASAAFEAHKAQVLDELVDVTSTAKGRRRYSTTFPPGSSADDVVSGVAFCSPLVGVSECTSCLAGAKLSLVVRSCAFMRSGIVVLPHCTVAYAPAA
ncbi:unnamed protein product [Linum trigynum]|uniref:Gnk2-homologous domain-containing protein n=1 Tax=Linum trigynum TaxID=586398 RepID=A0AAV2CA79_9ROSI